MVAPRGAPIMVAPRIKGELTMGILIIKRVLAALAVAAVFGTAALANVDGGGGEGTFEPKVYGASVDYDPNAPLPAPMPPGAFKF
jgi:hypothetical protein